MSNMAEDTHYLEVEAWLTMMMKTGMVTTTRMDHIIMWLKENHSLM
jgi:hypothetical protein